MFRILIAAILIYGVVKLWKKFNNPMIIDPSKQKSVTAGEMVSCSNCGTFVLRGEAFESSGLFYCGKECRK